ncbi:PREDICTED: UPF0415 protein C7orf25 homolog isoform X2 [Ceratosolen solmsi marchali]|uniref:UPF0415 protein C7orf25 homolog isoform X2 n=1 Tax=Ceratosolen solmsi marchali TaxID=326594 RepID=A0AAJ6YBX9_9HYME|nr:PREDICTED: UPF0415 protein C7orf25 homolog isoform X2 [Ceratosolen solmsi marchali]
MESNDDLIKCFDEKIKWGWNIIEELKLVEKVEGVDKLIRKIRQEIKFLKKVRFTGNVKNEHLQSTNLIHLNAIVKRLLSANTPVHVLKPFKYLNSKLEVDIVCDNGSSWVKVIARNAKALTLISDGNAEYGQKSVFDQADSYIKCAKNHPYMYKHPNIIFHFACGIEKPLADKLEGMFGIIIEGEKIEVVKNEDNNCDKLVHSQSESESKESFDINYCDLLELNTNINSMNVSILNLDVSSLLAYVTNMTNGHANFKFIEPLLTMQTEWERRCPIKPVLDELFKNKELIICQTAYDNFTNIVNVIGGPNEKKRSIELMYRIKIVDDTPKGRIMKLKLGGKIKARSRLIFASGDNLKSITVSANEGFVRAARMQIMEIILNLRFRESNVWYLFTNHARCQK